MALKKNKKNKVFKYLEEDKKYVFASLDSSQYLGESLPMLGYDLNLSSNSSFILSLRFKLLEHSSIIKRYIFSSEYFSFYVKEGTLYFENELNSKSICELNTNIWNNLIVYYNQDTTNPTLSI